MDPELYGKYMIPHLSPVEAYKISTAIPAYYPPMERTYSEYLKNTMAMVAQLAPNLTENSSEETKQAYGQVMTQLYTLLSTLKVEYLVDNLDCENQGILFKSPDFMMVAIQMGNLEMAMWLHDYGARWYNFVDVCGIAIANNDFDMLDFLRDEDLHGEQIARWGDSTARTAIEHGRLEMLKWMRDPEIHGGDFSSGIGICPWELETKKLAEEKLGYTDEHGITMLGKTRADLGKTES